MIIRLTENDLIKIVKKVVKESTTYASGEWKYPKEVQEKMKDYNFTYGFPFDYFLVSQSNNPNAITADELTIQILQDETQGEGQRSLQSDNKASYVVYVKPEGGKQLNVQTWNVYISLGKYDFNEKQANTLKKLFSNLEFSEEKQRYTFTGILQTNKVFEFVDYLNSYHNQTGSSNVDISSQA